VTLAALENTDRLCIHTMTTKALSLAEACAAYQAIGAKGITVWRHHLEGHSLQEARRILDDSGLEVVSLCRGGFFPATSAEKRREAKNENRRIIEEAAALAAPLVVLVCGADPELPLSESRQHILDGIAEIEPDAKSANVKLAIEPLHPMYADCRSAINTMEQANNMLIALNSPYVGIALDVYHTWWDPQLRAEIGRAAGKIWAFHVCDWRTPTRDLLNDREIMGKGCIPIRDIREWVEQSGFRGFIEVEIFSAQYWGEDQEIYLRQIRHGYLSSV